MNRPTLFGRRTSQREAELTTEIANLRADLANAVQRATDADERADFYTDLAVESANICNAMAAEADNLAAAAARALPDLGGPIYSPNPWGDAPIYDNTRAEALLADLGLTA